MGTKVRTTIEPGKVLEVDDAELVALHRQALLHSFERGDTTNALDLGKSPNRWRGGEAEVVDSGVITDSNGGDDDEDDAGDDTEGEGGK